MKRILKPIVDWAAKPFRRRRAKAPIGLRSQAETPSKAEFKMAKSWLEKRDILTIISECSFVSSSVYRLPFPYAKFVLRRLTGNRLHEENPNYHNFFKGFFKMVKSGEINPQRYIIKRMAKKTVKTKDERVSLIAFEEGTPVIDLSNYPGARKAFSDKHNVSQEFVQQGLADFKKDVGTIAKSTESYVQEFHAIVVGFDSKTKRLIVIPTPDRF